MGAIIYQRTISGSPDNAIQLSSGQFGRLVTLPTGWSKVRVGLHCHCTDPGVAVSSVSFFVGLGAGTTNMIGDRTTDHFVGTLITAADLWSRGATLMTGISVAAGKKVGTTTTVGGAISAGAALPNQAAGAGTDRDVWLVDITKGSPNYTVALFGIAVGPADYTSTYFLSQMPLLAPVFGADGVIGSGTVAVNEAVDGTLNAVQVSWNRSDFMLEIVDLAVALLA